jgi:hypothetical protein
VVAGLVGVPVSTLLANEAVYAAKYQSRRAAEQLDVALRLGFWRDSRCVTGCDAVDVDQLADDLHSGRARGTMLARYQSCRDDVQRLKGATQPRTAAKAGNAGCTVDRASRVNSRVLGTSRL